jgi:hypothetical protein
VTFYEEPGLHPAGYFEWTPNDFDSIAGQLEFRVYHNDDNLSEPHHDFVLSLGNRTPIFTSFPGPVSLTEDAFVNDPSATDQYTIFDWQIQTNEELVGVTYSLDVTTAAGITVHVNDSIPLGIDHHGNPNWVGAQINTNGGWVLFNILTGETEWKTTNADVTVDTGSVPDPANAYTFSVTADDHTVPGQGDDPPTATQSFIVQVLNDPTDIITDVPNQTFEQGVLWQLGDNDVVDRDERVGSNTWYTLTVAREGDAPVDVVAYNARVTGTHGAPVVFDPLTGEISWASTSNRDVGLYHFEVTHHDGHNTTDSDSFDVTVMNKVPTWTTSSPNGQVVMATRPFTYDANSNEEGHHDWRGDDVAEYSIVEGPSDMSIDSRTGALSWDADPKLAGKVTITIKMDDGNGGIIFQTFVITVDDTHQDLPENARNPRSPFAFDSQSPEPIPGPVTPIWGAVPDGIWGAWERLQPLTPEPQAEPGNEILEAILSGQFKSFDEVLKAIDEYGLRQPTLEKPGSTSPITELAGYPEDVAHGKRLDFNAGEIWQWQGLTQPSLDVAGSESPDTPLEGYVEAVESGKRLNFGFYPIKEARSLMLEEVRIADLLGL